jgi:hypothetical protein
MKKRAIRCLMPLLLVLIMAEPCLAGMTSASYRIPTSVIDMGGGAMASASYRTTGTAGQPSPLEISGEPVESASYRLYPGFWYTLGAPEVDECECDLNDDGRCDMRDWLLFGARWGATDCASVPCACDLNGDGRCDMRDWLIFGQDWGRTDCP